MAPVRSRPAACTRRSSSRQQDRTADSPSNPCSTASMSLACAGAEKSPRSPAGRSVLPGGRARGSSLRRSRPFVTRSRTPISPDAGGTRACSGARRWRGTSCYVARSPASRRHWSRCAIGRPLCRESVGVALTSDSQGEHGLEARRLPHTTCRASVATTRLPGSPRSAGGTSVCGVGVQQRLVGALQESVAHTRPFDAQQVVHLFAAPAAEESAGTP
jgi:hypothetical protein